MTVQDKDLYAILGVPVDADDASIANAYRALAQRLHPDVNGYPGAKWQFSDVAQAHDILSDSGRRREYDHHYKGLQQEAPLLNFTITPSKRVLPVLGEAQVTYVLAQIQPYAQVGHQQRPQAPLNLTLVLDRSKSMRGPRLDRVKLAAHQIIEQLGPQDFLSLVAFSDNADAIIKSEPVIDRAALRAMVNTITADGSTEIFKGLAEGLALCKRRLREEHVNHIILLTDGETYDDKQLSLNLADEAARRGIGISTMGIGEEWNDKFLDEIATKTGGYCAYINSPGAVVKFLNDRVRSLGAAYAERVHLAIAPDSDVTLESVFKLMPNPQPIDHTQQPIPLGILEHNRSITAIIQLQMPRDLIPQTRSLVRLEVMGDILHQRRQGYKLIADIGVEIAAQPSPEAPPRIILDALGKLTLYRMQQKAEQSIAAGNYEEATRRLENLSTRLLALGHTELAETAHLEALQLQKTKGLSQEGRKTIKFGTRLLLQDDDSAKNDQTKDISNADQGEE
jgi:Ca-activated chloride channel family protein